jgi:flagellar biosynthesis GTPase FlhF
MKATTTNPFTTAEPGSEQQSGNLQDAAAKAEQAAAARVYRGRTVAELIPKIQSELGSEAVVTGRRSGLEGGIGGFFQRPFVEIQAQPGGPRVDLCDGDEALPPVDLGQSGSFEPLAASALSLANQAESFMGEGAADQNGFASALAAAAGESADETEGPLPVGSATAAGAAMPYAPVAVNGHAANGNSLNGSSTNGVQPVHVAAQALQEPRSRTEAALAAELEQAGFDASFVAEILDTAQAHVLAFSPRMGLRRAARVALERHLPHAAAQPPAGGVVVLVGPGGAGKTTCVAAVAECYRRAGATHLASGELAAGPDGVLQMSLAPHLAGSVDFASKQAQSALTVARSQGLALLDTPAVSPADGAGIKALARLLTGLAAERVVVALPATLSASAAARLLQALKPLKPNAIAITHADECDQLGVAVQAACHFGLAPEYMLTGAHGASALTRVEPSTLTERLLP